MADDAWSSQRAPDDPRLIWSPGQPGTGIWRAAAYRGAMGRLILILLAALIVVMLVSLVISALHFLFWVAVVAVVLLGAVRLSSMWRRSSR